MVNVKLFKKTVKKLLYQNNDIQFLGQNFNKIVFSFSDGQADDIYSWMKRIIARSEKEIRPRISKKYFGFNSKELITFLKRISVDGVAYRILLVKVKNSFYIEFHLGNHDYYDKTRLKLGLK